MKTKLVALLLLLPLLAGAQALDTLAAKKSLDSLIRISASQRFKGEYEAMRASSVQMIALAERLHGRKSAPVAIGLNNLAQAAMNLGDLDLAIRSTEESLAIRKALHGRINQFVAWNYSNLGILYSRTGRLAEAEACLLEFKAITAENLGARHSDVGYALVYLSNFYQGIGRYKEAEACILEAKDIWRDAFGQESANYATILSNLGVFVHTLGRFGEAERHLLEAKRIRDKVLKPDHPDYAAGLNNLGNLYNGTGRHREAIPLLEQAIQIWGNRGERDRAAYASALVNLSGAYAGIGDKIKAEALLIESLERTQKAPDKGPGDYARRLHNLAYLYKNSGRVTEADSLFSLSESMLAKSIGRISLEYVTALINHATAYEAMEQYDACDRLLAEIRALEYELLKQVTQFLSEEELSRYIARFSDRGSQPFCVAIRRNVASGLLADLCFNSAIVSKGYVQETVSSIRQQTLSDTASTRRFEALAALRRKLAQEYTQAPGKRDTLFIAYAETRANAIEKEMTRTAGLVTGDLQITHTQDIRERLAAGEAAVEFVSFTYFDIQGYPTDSTLYTALVLLPTPEASGPHFIPLFEERQLQALLNRPELGEELTVKGLYAPNSELLSLLWTPMEPLLRDVKTIYYSPAGLLHRINPAALRDADKQPLSDGRQWVRVGSTRELVTGRLADRSFAHEPAAPPTAAVWGGIRYDMDSMAFAAANPLDPAAKLLPEFRRKDGKFRYMVEDGTPELPAGTRGAGDAGWKPLAGSAREAEQVGELLQKTGFRAEVLSGYAASEERFKALGQGAPSPRILHVATHGFAYPDPKAPSFRRGLGEDEPVYKIQDDPMLRSGLLLAGANHYWTAKRPLQDREDGVLVAYEVRDLNLRNTELAVLSACQTGLGDVVGSEGVYGLQRAFRIAGAKFLIVSLWQVPDEQTRELMRLFYENWVDKRESLRDAFNHAQATLREQEPNPYMWAGFVLVE